MLSRRSVRIKVMQMLYATSRDNEITLDEVVTMYWNKVNDTKNLLMFTLYLIFNITKGAEDDFQKRSKKYLPTEEDKSFSPKLYTNQWFQKFIKKPNLQKIFKDKNFKEKVDSDVLTNLYNEFAKEEEYKIFLQKEESAKNTRDVLLDLFRFCRANETFIELIEDQYINWEDDKSLIVGGVKKIFKSIQNEEEVDLSEFDPDEATVRNFGELLLKRTFSKESSLLNHIQPVLKNWDSDRVAVIDLICIKLALCELLEFETIAPKVTLNEYIDLAKVYSTPKSKEFVNGILDTLASDLNDKNLLNKEGRGLIE